MIETMIDVCPRGTAPVAERSQMRRLPFTIEHVATPPGAGFEFEWNGASAYLALHDIVLSDGTMAGDDIAPITMLDMRRRMTFLPSGVRAKGWCEPVERENSFTVLYFDQDWLLDELEVAPGKRDLQPSVYFQNKRLLHFLEQLGQMAKAHANTPKIVADSLAVMAGAELLRSLTSRVIGETRLTPSQVNQVRDFIDARVAEDLSLADLAAVLGLSVFHFSRQFKKAVGVTPYRYVLEARTERAKQIMCDEALPLSVVAEMCGFSSPSHFSRTFVEIVGVTPRVFRDARNA